MAGGATFSIDHRRSAGVRARGSTTMMLKAQVREGRLVLDEPTDLPEGTEIELTPVFDDDLGPEERQALEASLARSAAQLARDELVDADEVLRRVRRG